MRGERLLAATGAHAIHAFVHVDDTVDGLLRCLDLSPGVHVVNLAAEVRSVVDIAQAVWAAAALRGLRVEIDYVGRPGPYAARRVSSRLEALGFSATRRLEDSMGSVIDYYLSHLREADAVLPGGR